MNRATPLTAPPRHVDFVFDAAGAMVSTGPGAAEWLDDTGALPMLCGLLEQTRGSRPRTKAWWASARPIYLRFVPMEGADGPQYLCTVVPTRPELAEALELLTPTQQEVAEYAAAGATVAEIAEVTGRSPETIRTHVKEIYRRLSICTRLELQWLMRRPAISFDP